MNAHLVFLGSFVWNWGSSVTGGPLAFVLFILFAVSAPVPGAFYAIMLMFGLIEASYKIWKDQHSKLTALRSYLVPRLEIGTMGIYADNRFRILVKNLSGMTVRFSARLESVEPSIDYGLPVYLQITHINGPVGDVPPYGTALVDVFVDCIEERFDEFDVMIESKGITFLVCGDPPRGIDKKRQEYRICVCVYPIEPNTGIGAFRQFLILPHDDDTCIFTSVGELYQKPIL